MEWVRGSKRQGKSQVNFLHDHHIAQTAPMEDVPWKPVVSPVATLETDNRYVDISNLDKHFPKLTNRYAVLSEDDVDYDDEPRLNHVLAGREK